MPSPWHQHPTAYPEYFRHKREEQVVAHSLYSDFFCRKLGNDQSTVVYRDKPNEPFILEDREFEDEKFRGVHYHGTMLDRKAFEYPQWRITITSTGGWGNWRVLLNPRTPGWWEIVTVEEMTGDWLDFRSFLVSSGILSAMRPVEIWEGDLPSLNDSSYEAIRDLADDAVRYPGVLGNYRNERHNARLMRINISEIWFVFYRAPSEMLRDDVWIVDVGFFHELYSLGVDSEFSAFLFDSRGGEWGEWSCFVRHHKRKAWFEWINGDAEAMRAYLDRHVHSLRWEETAD